MPYQSKIGCEDDETFYLVDGVPYISKDFSSKIIRYKYDEEFREKRKEYAKNYYHRNIDVCRARSAIARRKWYASINENEKKIYREKQLKRYYIRKNRKSQNI